MLYRSHVSLSLCLIIAACMIVPIAAHAESVVWSNTYSTRLCGPDGIGIYNAGTSREGDFKYDVDFCKWFKADNPNVSVQYQVNVVDDATGTPVPSGSTVPAGTRLRYEFVPHVDSDISWFLTGFAIDSPYGEWGTSAPPLACRSEYLIYGRDQKEYAQYAELMVAPPNKNISGPDAGSCISSGSSKTCTLTGSGTYTATFDFSPTTGYFYGRGHSGAVHGCFGINEPLQEFSTRATFVVEVPQQNITHTVTVLDTDQNPQPTSAVTTASVTGNPSCTVGVPYAITLNSTDSESRNVRYGIDWNADGIVDEFIPPFGFVPSGTAQLAFRIFAITGQKTVRVFAQNENGAISPWVSHTFSCSNARIAQLPADEDDGGSQNDSGDTTPSPTLNIRAIPSLVRRGNSTQVHWSAENVQSCTVTSNNGDAWSGIVSPVGGESSKPISGTTEFTLACLDLSGNTATKTAKVLIQPDFIEI